MKKIFILMCSLMVAISMGACVKLGGKPLNKKYYRIKPVRVEQQPHTQGTTVLKIRRMLISDLYKSRELIYQMSDGRIESDFYNMYFVPPSNMLTTELRSWLKQSDLFPHLIDPGSMVVPTLTLESVTNELYGDFSTDQPVAVVSMQFYLVDENTANNDIVFSQDYTRRIPVATAEPGALITAMTQAVTEIFTELEHDLAAANLNKV